MNGRAAALLRLVFGLIFLIYALDAALAAPEVSGIDGMPPYKMVRTLEYVQDSIVAGDHAAIAMQDYLLKTIDKRLRAAKVDEFDDSRNVDAALIYAMSGGNPETLALLASRDVEGHFDHRLVEALGVYFSGKPEQARPNLEAVEKGYRDTAIGPYLALVTANSMVRHDPKKALVLYDWVRLLAPGTILEESALRRSIEVSDELKLPGKGLAYSRMYAERFLHSPYAGQFADLFVRLVVDNAGTIDQARVLAILAGMDDDHQSGVYLRIARRAAVAGRTGLARSAAARAAELSEGKDRIATTLAGFYGDLASVPTAEVQTAMASLAAVPEGSLSSRDQALKAAALAVARQVAAIPTPESVAQASRANMHERMPESKTIYPTDHAEAPSHPVHEQAADRHEAEKQFAAFVDAKRAKLKAVDALLKKDSK
ncbi:MAG TPA: chemotaxis protein [Pararhizobium sp.]|nr:chemotaxis protein [Pararhizobium sp.]